MGNLFPAEVEWGIVITAAVLLPLICVKDALNWCGILGHRCGVGGGPSQVPIHGRNENFRKLARELTDLGYRPLGMIWEKLFLSGTFREYLFVHPEHHGYVTAFNLFGDEFLFGRVVVFESGVVVKTMSSDADSVETDDYIVKRLGSCPVSGLIKSHQVTENRFLKRGEVPIPCNTVEEIVLVNRIAFAHPMEQAGVIDAGRVGVKAKLTVAASCGLPVGVGAVGFFIAGRPVVGSMMALGAAMWVILVALFFMAITVATRWFGQGSNNDEAIERSPILNALQRGFPYGLGVIIVVAWQFGVKPAALATLAVTGVVAIAELGRLVMVNCRKVPDTHEQM